MLDAALTSVSLSGSLASLPPLALAASDKITEVDLSGTAVDTIGDYALYNLSQVRQLTIPATAEYIGTRAMVGMTGLEQIYALATRVPELGDQVWLGVNQPSVVLKVPAGSRDYYLSADQWRYFSVQSSGVPGDANGDGDVSVTDVLITVDYVLGKNPAGFIFANANVNGDNE